MKLTLTAVMIIGRTFEVGLYLYLAYRLIDALFL